MRDFKLRRRFNAFVKGGSGGDKDKKYFHVVTCSSSTNWVFTLTYIDSNSDPSATDFIGYLYDKGFNANDKYYPASGCLVGDGEIEGAVQGVIATSASAAKVRIYNTGMSAIFKNITNNSIKIFTEEI